MHICSSNFPQSYGEPQQQSYYSLIGFRTPEYLAFLLLQVDNFYVRAPSVWNVPPPSDIRDTSRSLFIAYQ
jgi:hypothetical protein